MGALGPVFRTYEPARDRLVAVKVFRLDITPEQAQLLADQLARVAEADLFNRAIVEPIAAGLEGTVAYKAEEYVAAESLDAALRHYAPASPGTVLRVIGQLGGAIDAARAAGVGHGALHPRDVFITPEEARASGFGVVDALERLGLRAPVRRPYSAPERMRGASWDLPADVFSLAAIAFELLTGRRPPAAGDDIGSLDGASLQDPRPVRDVLVRAMHEDPDERFGTGQAFAEALTAAAGADGARVFALGATAFADEAPDRTIQLIPVPVDPEFADEGDDDRLLDHQQSPAEDTVVAQPDEGTPDWGLTGGGADEAPELGPDVLVQNVSLDGRHVQERDNELMFDAAELALAEGDSGRGPTESGPALREGAAGWSGDMDPAPVGDEDADSHPGIEEGGPSEPGSERPTWLFDASPEAPKVIERDTWVEPVRQGGEPGPDVRAWEEPAAVDRSLWPVGVVLALGLLLIGFGGGYVVRGRSLRSSAAVPSETAAPAATQPAASAGAAPRPSEPASGRVAAAAPARAVAGTRPSASPRSAAASAPARRGDPAATARAGRLVVRSTPPGADVMINGKWSGRTPLTKDALAFGSYNVLLSLRGYRSRREQVSLRAGSASQMIELPLQRNAAEAPLSGTPGGARSGPGTAGTSASDAAGSLEIDSRPTGARVLVDGTPVGTTPLRLADVTPGQHVIRLELAGHEPWTQNTQVVRGKPGRVAGSLEPIR